MRKVALLVLSSLIVSIPVFGNSPAFSTPVATDASTYQVLGRIFPDPHACRPDGSPWAKGKVCAADFIQYQEMVDGIKFLEKAFPDFVEFYTLHKDFNCTGMPVSKPEDGCPDFKSSGIPQTVTDSGETNARERLPLHMVRITDESVPSKDKKYFVFPLSIHGIERAGAEGGTRAAEDLATWGACEAGKAPEYVDCEDPDNAAPHPLLEATPKKSIMAGDALKKSAVYFVWPNPDGWHRGDRDNGVAFYQRYNGNGVDLNRDWPERGWTYLPYTPWSEPESRAFGKVLPAIGPKDENGHAKWDGGIDLHGMIDAKAFSFTLLGGTQRPFDKNQRVLQTVKGAWADAEARLAYSPMIKPNTAEESDPRQYGVQWGTIWDSIDYTVTGAFGNWIDSPMGLNADGIDNEMAFSHLSNCGVGSCFEPDIEQLHIDGNKSLIYSMMNYTLKPEDTTFHTKGRVAYLYNQGVESAESKPLATNVGKYRDLPTQKPIQDISLSSANDYTFPFKVEGPPKVYNGGLEVTLTCTNVQGVGACGLGTAVLEHKGTEHPGGSDEEWETVNTYNGSGAGYFQTGQALHANNPAKGAWRVRIQSGNGTFDGDIRFTKEQAWPDPGQMAYKATSMRFWEDLSKFADPGIDKITIREIKKTDAWRKRYDTIVLTNRSYRGLAKPLRSWVADQDGNLVLTDEAINMLDEMAFVDTITGERPSILKTGVYAGYINFATESDDVTYDDPLARNIDQKGAAEGRSCEVKQSGIIREEVCDDNDELHRRQTYEPVPLGYSLEEGGDNSPVWFVRQRAWDNARGKERAVGTSTLQTRVSLGEIKWKGGRIRIIGALLPDPTEKFYHPYGLSDYALTWAGYQVLQNALTYQR